MNTSQNTQCTCYIIWRMASTLILVCFCLIPRSLQSPGSRLYPDQMVDQHREMWTLQLWMLVETRTTRSSPETDPQWRPCLLDGHRDKTPGTKWVLCIIWLCFSLDLNCWFCLARGEWHYFDTLFSKYCKADVKPPSFISSWCKAALTQFALLKALYK